MRILSIETSCDETAVSIVTAGGTVAKPSFTLLGNALFSQASLHAEYGGVFPTLAKREHAKNLPPLLVKALQDAKLYKIVKTPKAVPVKIHKEILNLLDREQDEAKALVEIGETVAKPKIDAIAVTFGPGLEPTLWVGITFAQALGKLWNIPVVPVNHMEGHIVSPLFTTSNKLQALSYPLLALLISGGHTELVYASKPLHYETIGATRDDALGECFDKVARMMGLPYPGGPLVSKLAQTARDRGYNEIRWHLPRPMIYTKDLDFSFSGLKTAVLYAIRDHGNMNDEDKQTLAKEFEDAVTDVIIAKTRKAIIEYGPKTLVVGGGVIANTFIRAALSSLTKDFVGLEVLIPDRDLATDNAVMIAMAGYLRIKAKPALLKSKKKIFARGTAALS